MLLCFTIHENVVIKTLRHLSVSYFVLTSKGAVFSFILMHIYKKYLHLMKC